jgi:hypothetical protein
MVEESGQKREQHPPSIAHRFNRRIGLPCSISTTESDLHSEHDIQYPLGLPINGMGDTENTFRGSRRCVVLHGQADGLAARCKTPLPTGHRRSPAGAR